ncbi:MAG: hypothetical protein CMH53_05625 [Myxococcales bacterium]|nr:hypothetical protein [Myxococcales bacterium]
MQTAVPAVILIVGFSDIIHLYSAYLLELQAGQDQREAIIASSAEVGRACLFTSLTTFIGFVSLSLVPTPAFRHLGLVLGFGVAVALLLAVTATPIALLWLPRPPLDSKRTQSRAVKGLVRWCQDTALRSPRWVIAAFFALTVVAGVGVSRLHIDTDMIKRLPEQGRTQRDAKWFSESFAGTGTVEIYIDSGTPGGALEPALLAAVARFQDAVETIVGVDQVASFVTLIERMHDALGGQGRLPNSRAAVAQELLLFEMRGGKNLERMVDFDRQRLRIGVRLQATAMRQTYDAAEQIRAVAARTLPAKVSVEVTGLGALLGAWLDQILNGQLRGLALSILTITLMMSWMVRSLRVGLWSMVPNLLPLWVLGGYAGWRWDAVDSDMIFVAMLAIGIGVDDTIHFLSRYRIESNRNADDRAALKRTFRFAGRAIVMTTIILVAGHLPFASSAYFSTRILGTLLPMCMIVALVADLLLVPAMVQVGWMSLSPSGLPSDATSTTAV